MKLIKAYIRHRKAEDVYRGLNVNGFTGMTFVGCEGTGKYSDREKGHISKTHPFAGACRVIKQEILVADEHVKQVVEIIRKNGRAGCRGDGMILVSPGDEVYKVSTDEQGILKV